MSSSIFRGPNLTMSNGKFSMNILILAIVPSLLRIASASEASGRR
jgi:hypothetical protein